MQPDLSNVHQLYPHRFEQLADQYDALRRELEALPSPPPRSASSIRDFYRTLMDIQRAEDKLCNDAGTALIGAIQSGCLDPALKGFMDRRPRIKFEGEGVEARALDDFCTRAHANSFDLFVRDDMPKLFPNQFGSERWRSSRWPEDEDRTDLAGGPTHYDGAPFTPDELAEDRRFDLHKFANSAHACRILARCVQMPPDARKSATSQPAASVDSVADVDAAAACHSPDCPTPIPRWLLKKHVTHRSHVNALMETARRTADPNEPTPGKPIGRRMIEGVIHVSAQHIETGHWEKIDDVDGFMAEARTYNAKLEQVSTPEKVRAQRTQFTHRT